MLAVALTLLIGVAGWLVARRLGLSAPAMLGSMLAAGITNALFGPASMLAEVRVFAQSISGAFIQMSVRRRDLAKARKLIAPVLILFSMLTINALLLARSLVGSTTAAETFSSASASVVPALLLFASYWLVNFLFTQVCRHWRLLDVKSAMFASAPGGASDIALIAADLDADLAKIAGIQIMRAVYAVAVMSPLCCCLPPRWGRGPLSGVRGAWGGAARCVWT